jgi:hypothetical protein
LTVAANEAANIPYNAAAASAAKLGMNPQGSKLKFDESGEPLHVQQAAQIRAFRNAWKEAGHARTPRVPVSRSVFPLMNVRDRAYFGDSCDETDQFGIIDSMRAACRPQLRRRARRLDRAAAKRRSDHRSRHPAAHDPEPIGRGI